MKWAVITSSPMGSAVVNNGSALAATQSSKSLSQRGARIYDTLVIYGVRATVTSSVSVILILSVE